MHPGSRKLFEALQVGLDTSKGVIPDVEVLQMKYETESLENPIDFPKLNEDLYFILVDKCEGEAASRVMSALRGNGLEAFQHVYLWFAGQSGMALSKRMQWIMNPPVPKDDYELSEGLEKWITQMTALANVGREYILQTPFKFAALRVLMTNKVDKFDQLKEQAKGSAPQDIAPELLQETIFTIFIQQLREYVTEKRLESNFGRKNADDMDIGNVDETEEEHPSPEEEQEWGGQEG